MRALRKLVLGETWAVPAGVALTLALALVLEAVHAGDWGGFAILGAAVATLVASLALRPGATARRASSPAASASGSPAGAGALAAPDDEGRSDRPPRRPSPPTGT